MPASFDAAAQRLTLDAAEQAGFPGSVRLLEEPQAAFYCWLEQHAAAEPLWQGSDPYTAAPRHVLIVDVGGGTSDFSLFELRPGASGTIPDITAGRGQRTYPAGRRQYRSRPRGPAGTSACAGTRPDVRPTMGSPRRVVSRSERALAFGCRPGAGAIRRGIAGPGVRPGGRGTDRNAGARRGRAAGAGWLFSGLRCAAPGPIAPSRVCATGGCPTRPTARSRIIWPISSATARAWMPYCSTAVRSMPRSCASGC